MTVGARLTSLEDSPWDTGNQVIRQQVLYLCRRDRDRDQRGEQDQAPKHDFFVAESFGDDTVQRETENFTAVGGLLTGGREFGVVRGREGTYVTETGLPSCWNLISSIGTQHAKPSVELRKGVYVDRQSGNDTGKDGGYVTHKSCPTNTDRIPPWRYTSK